MHLYQTIASRAFSGLLALTTVIVPSFAIAGTVQADGGLRMREDSNTTSAVITTLPDGAAVDVTATTEGGWFKVAFQEQIGFVSNEYVTVNAEEAATLEVLKDPIYGRVTEGPLNVRAGAGTDFDKVTQVGTGAVMEILATVDGWYQIDSGYVSSDYVSIIDAAEAAAAAEASTTGNEIATYAKQFLGSRYVYGGSSPKGFDCSGFTRYVLAQFGITINRTASAQMDNGTKVAMGELQPGDLVFFLKRGSGASRASHVGIYIGGDQFIHASTAKTGVIISDMDSAYYTTGFVGGRRLA